MTSRRMGVRALLGTAGVLCLALTSHADESGKAPDGAAGKSGDGRVSVAAAKEQARLMHRIHAATLEAMHHYYFREDRPVLPARAMEDVFADLDEQAKIQTRWIAVNTPPMSVHHEAKSDFEKRAAAAIAAGKESYERVEGGYYRHAGAIPLRASCVGCHARFSMRPATTPRFAGLVISIPVREE